MSIRKMLRKVMPTISTTEQEALEAGQCTNIETLLLRGKPDFGALFDLPYARLNEHEQQFIDGPLQQLLGMINDYDLQKDVHVPEAIMEHLKQHKFFSMIIPRSFGGLEFTPYANSCIVAKIASVSPAIAVLVMVPNSLGPGELLLHYGTESQQERWLRPLAEGKEMPCFALTSPDAGSDAGSITDKAIVFRNEKGELALRINWDKRYITLAPIATLIGVAFKVYDPEHLLGDDFDLGITCALIPSNLPGVQNGRRHDPMGVRFYNGPTKGINVEVPIEDYVIGGKVGIGKGWKMLVSCLGAGRGISLPAMGTASAQLSLLTTSLYSDIRQQFNTRLKDFEGVQDKMAELAGKCYITEAMRVMTTEILNTGVKPSIVTAIAKYQMTEYGRDAINLAMDVQAGKAIQRGPMNSLATCYQSQPIGITVEGANILTRCLMIYGQGSMRCHPFLQEMVELIHSDDPKADSEFNTLLRHTIKYTVTNFARSAVKSHTPSIGYRRRVERLSANLATLSDTALAILGGKIKKSEMLSARLADMIIHLYAAMACLRYHESIFGSEHEPIYRYAMEYTLHRVEQAKWDFVRNFPNPVVRTILRVSTGSYLPPKPRIKDKLIRETALQSASVRGTVMSNITSSVYVTRPISDMVSAQNELHGLQGCSDDYKKVKKLIKQYEDHGLYSFEHNIGRLYQDGQVSQSEVAKLMRFEELRKRVVQVDDFDFDLN